MQVLGCLLGFFLALFIFAWASVQRIILFITQFLNGGRSTTQSGNTYTRQASSQEQATRSSDSHKHFDSENRQYVDFEEIKDEDPQREI